MKKVNLFSKMVCFLVILVWFQGCVTDEEPSQEIALERSENNEIWSQQLIKFSNSENASLLEEQGLKLMEAQFSEKNTASSILGMRKLNSNLIPVYSNQEKVNEFKLVSKMELSGTRVNLLNEKKETLMSAYSDSEMNIIDLKWNYKGEVFASECFISLDSGVVYDDILSNIRFMKVYGKQEQKDSLITKILNPKRMKLNCEIPDGPISYSFSSPQYVIENWIGDIVAKAEVDVTVSGVANNCIKYISSATYDAPYYSDDFHEAEAQVKMVEFNPQGGYFHYEWGAGVSDGQISLSWDGFGYIIQGHKYGNSGGYNGTEDSLN